MSLPVHLVPDLADAAIGGTVVVEGDEAHHAVAVRRTRVGERVVLTDGRGTSVTGPVAATGKRWLEVAVEEIEDRPRVEPELVVVQALPKGDRGELAVEVLTEVGVDRVVPWAAARCVAAWRGERVAKGEAKWRATAREAAKQARRAWFPRVDALASTDDVVALVAAADLAVVLHEEATTPLRDAVLPATGTAVLVVGPEGGIAPEELAALEAAGATVCRMGPEVLRTSTAGVAALAALQAPSPRWG